jgi:type IV pilus assembly protein PilB
MTNNPLLDALMGNGTLTQSESEQVLAYSQAKGISIPSALVESGVIKDGSKGVLLEVARLLQVEFFDLTEVNIDKQSAMLMSQAQANSMEAIPLYEQEGTLFVAVPLELTKSIQAKDDIRKITGKSIVRLVASTRSDIKNAINQTFRADEELTSLVVGGKGSSVVSNQSQSPENIAIPDEITEESEVVRFVDLVLGQGIKDKASDIHFDPTEHKLQIRYRVDGILYNMSDAPKYMIPEITSRIKIMANLDISKTRVPQDGRLSIRTSDNRKIDLRVATLPSNYGEKIVMRILDNSSAQLALTQLGFSDINLERFRTAALRPYGMVLVTGPTGSGKSTTLYSALNEIASPEINIITAEDPIEYQIAGITQVPVNPKQGLTFEAVLRTILRADPDVILVGEIRDLETARIAMQAGLTGHMVFSTLHTNDAASAITRLGDMGVESFITASTLVGIVSQRLVRRLCKKCKTTYEPTELDMDAVGFGHADGIPTLYKPNGCKECNQTGYRGRLAIHEVLNLTEPIQEAIVAGAKAIELNRMAVADGMISLKEDGFEKVRQGLTSIQEIVRVVA